MSGCKFDSDCTGASTPGCTAKCEGATPPNYSGYCVNSCSYSGGSCDVRIGQACDNGYTCDFNDKIQCDGSCQGQTTGTGTVTKKTCDSGACTLKTFNNYTVNSCSDLVDSCSSNTQCQSSISITASPLQTVTRGQTAVFMFYVTVVHGQGSADGQAFLHIATPYCGAGVNCSISGSNFTATGPTDGVLNTLQQTSVIFFTAQTTASTPLSPPDIGISANGNLGWKAGDPTNCYGTCEASAVTWLRVNAPPCSSSISPAPNNGAGPFPLNFQCTNRTSTSYTLNWNPAGWTGGSGTAANTLLRVDPTQSQVYGGCPGAGCAFAANAAYGIGSYTATGLKPSTTYYNRVVATCTNTDGTLSFKDLPDYQTNYPNPSPSAWQCSTLACTPAPFSAANSSISPSSVSPGGSYVAKCDFGVITPNIPPPSGCSFSGTWDGTKAVFNCTAPTTPGSYPVTCTLNNAAPDYYCASSSNTAGTLTVTGSSACTANSWRDCGFAPCQGKQQCNASGTGWGACDYSSSNGLSCNDSLACTSPDTCSNGTCSGPNNPTNGGWSSWSACVNGVQTRTCNNPAPVCGGSGCSGSSTQTCTVQSYSYTLSGSPNFTATQGGAWPASQGITVTNTGTQSLNLTVGEGMAWASIDKSSISGLAPGSSAIVYVSITDTSLSPAIRTGTVDFTNTQGAGNQSANVTYSITSNTANNDSQCLAVTVPASMTAGQTYTATVQMKNTGSSTWFNNQENSANPYQLVPVQNIWGTTQVNLPMHAIANARYARIRNTNSGSSWSAWYELEAYDTNNGKLLPSGCSASQSYATNPCNLIMDGDVNTTFWNSGAFAPPDQWASTDLTGAGSNVDIARIRARLRSTDINANPLNSPGPAYLETEVNGGASYTSQKSFTNMTNNQWYEVSYGDPNSTHNFTNFQFTAPAAAGSYNFSWQMAQGSSKFGAICSQPVTITPAANPPTVDLKCDGQDNPTIDYNGGCANFSWTVTNADSCVSSGANSLPAGNWSSGITGNTTLTNLTANQNFVLSCTGPGGGPVTDTMNITVRPQGPTGPTGSGGPSCQQATLNWNAVGAAVDGYYIYRNTTNDFASATKLLPGITPGNATSYLDTTAGSVNYYWITAYKGASESAPVSFANNPIGSASCNASLSVNKDILKVNGTAPAGYTTDPGNNNESPTNINYNKDDTVTFAVNINYNAASGGNDATNVVVTDQLINVSKPASGWDMKLDGNSVSEDTTVDCTNSATAIASIQAGKYGVCGANLTQQTIYVQVGTIKQSDVRKILTFTGQLAVPSGYTQAYSRFQNSASVAYSTNGSGGTDRKVASTPLLLFYVNSVPVKTEVPP